MNIRKLILDMTSYFLFTTTKITDDDEKEKEEAEVGVGEIKEAIRQHYQRSLRALTISASHWKDYPRVRDINKKRKR